MAGHSPRVECAEQAERAEGPVWGSRVGNSVSTDQGSPFRLSKDAALRRCFWPAGGASLAMSIRLRRGTSTRRAPRPARIPGYRDSRLGAERSNDWATPFTPVEFAVRIGAYVWSCILKFTDGAHYIGQFRYVRERLRKHRMRLASGMSWKPR
jgi:hypothetical protein